MALGATTTQPPKNAELRPLFEPLTLGALNLPHRILMAPLTRNRAHPDGTPHEMAIEYYRQRAGAGLIISEASQVSPMGKGYIDTPGIHDDAFIEPWKRITDAVHEAGGRMVLQLWHVGRISHPDLLPEGCTPISASALQADAKAFTREGFKPTAKPEAMSLDQISGTIEEYVAGARRAMAAGFDGVEIHGANGYLIDQFIRSKTNERDDDYGGSLDNRLRFVTQIVDGVASEVGASRTGIRLSPTGTFGDIADDDPVTTFSTLVERLNAKGLAYLHMVEKFAQNLSAGDEAILKKVRAAWSGLYLANGDYSATDGAEAIASGYADAVAYGRAFIANPDLPNRFALGAPLNEPNEKTFYGGDEKGYTDYPFLSDGFTAA
ncbi:MAG: alkene reductase [Pseudomonadota bacterium]